MNKREFVLAGGVLAAGGALPALARTAGRRPATPTGAAAWQHRIGQRFEVFGTPLPAQLELRRVVVHDDRDALQQYTLLFAASGATLGRGTQVLRQSDGAALALYLDEAGADAAGRPLLRAHFCQLG